MNPERYREIIEQNAGLERCLKHLIGLSAVPNAQQWLRDQVGSIELLPWKGSLLDEISGKPFKMVFREYSVWYHLSGSDSCEPYSLFKIGETGTNVEDLLNTVLDVQAKNGRHSPEARYEVVFDAVACHDRSRTKEQRYWTDKIRIYNVPSDLLA